MALNFAHLAAHLRVEPAQGMQVLLDAATKHIERLLGFKIDDAEQFPEGTPADLERAILMLAADFYENREASLVGVTAQTVPFGVREIVDEYRNYTFGLADED